MLIDYAECENACATSDAYKLKEYVHDIKFDDFDPIHHLKIINTGTVGKYDSKWGKSKMTYLKDKYDFPVLDKTAFKTAFKNSYMEKSFKPKIIIKGLTLLDGCIDLEGQIVPGKSTLVISKPKGREHELYFPLAVVNSKLAMFYIKEKYRGSSYNQGINFNTDMLNNLPVPEINNQNVLKIESIIQKILSLKKNGLETAELEEVINQTLYKIYNFTFDEVKQIDSGFSLSEAEYKAVEI